MPTITPSQAGGENRCAFLDMLAGSEIGPALLAATQNGYNVLVGSTPAHPLTFPSYAAHPDILNRALNSTAAGRYQLLYRYWLSYSKMLNLPDFGPLSQDKIALQQIRECNALPFIDAGNFAHAVALCSRIWASLPGNDYGQHQNTIALLQSYFTAAGGALS
ncbi:glycoside hydrolase family 104 protein [Paraburkholderia sp. Ac-20347]|uniref:glycoside hydrolase family 24 protein n=1 Tax=Paraburkholderia sp. Ac-20347 TaxID=2703892 RepID=UPI00197EE744|nr:glycoside hydrolase family 104 protein [Paraburkholderia sp. Ac-20347]MBN3811713.1 glycoside hydrolase family 104 protein [Paraburkholderia sp. Ac-20347]